MNNTYTEERNFQMLIALLKKRGINTVIASPGTANIALVASVQGDPFFTVYSAPDERSAAYMACGFAAESGKPVVLTCTGATASRNYMPGLTEAYYRKLPVIAVTSARHAGYIGQLTPQCLDRTVIPNDIAVTSVQVPSIHSDEDAWNCNLKLNEALLAITGNGGGPVHINIVSEVSHGFGVKELPQTRLIERYEFRDEFPEIEAARVAVFVGNHRPFDKRTEEAIDRFCERHNGCVLVDRTSNYHGAYGVEFNLISDQSQYTTDLRSPELLIDLGEITGSYMRLNPREVWRVSEDGEIRDRFKTLTKVFDMTELEFFDRYTGGENREHQGNDTSTMTYWKACSSLYEDIASRIPELPFSNLWVAKTLSAKLPKNSKVHLGILNSLRSWNFFESDDSIDCYSNTGGFGIDGILSTMLGGALAAPESLHFAFLGDLAFFYDMNALGNHHVTPNMRILLVNNGVGTEFKNYNHLAARFGEGADDFIAAAGHYGNRSRNLVRHYAEGLGFDYLCASDKDEFLDNVDAFISPEMGGKPMIFEVFTSSDDESDALKAMNLIVKDKPTIASAAKGTVKRILGDGGVAALKQIVRG
ncbi:thiamine pyrophosphate-binding protein [Bifidobacterium sp. UTBIF-78]|uniref:thiamine pyrophosphate-binding protein n=1 Tax=Bifidobacterium sp. UTBIF-78 TaxID=1465263 RepID=UPI0011285F2C|nr:thiamine pyrophosphate-binding protein [Bifidobacterium sp. UTBIF-78]TPF95427.1 thiamine pyrophosphate-binding protein [Bifidobacterium sp. UTBIF-78]